MVARLRLPLYNYEQIIACLSRYEWGHGDDSLKIGNLPKAQPPPGQQGLEFS